MSLLDAKKSCLLLVDVQKKTIPIIYQAEELIKNCHWLLQVAHKVNVPILVSEHCAEGETDTVSPLAELVQEAQRMSKFYFSCAVETDCMQKILSLQRDQIVIMGTETHVCVLQTAVHLQQAGKEVFIVADAVSSRHKLDDEMALRRMERLGIQIITKEMALYEWAEKSGTELFKELTIEFLR